jgi:outer membrane protein TolC
MSRVRLAALLVLLAPLPAAGGSYTLESFVERVTSTAPQVDAVQNVTDSWRAKLGEAQRNWAPTGGLSLEMRNTPNIKCADVNGYVNPDPGARGANCVRTQTVDLLRSYGRPEDAQPFAGLGVGINLSLIQPFYTFGKLEAGIGAARAQTERFKAEIEGARADARHRATEAWWKLKWAKAALSVAEYDVGYYSHWVAGIEESLKKGEKTFSEKEQLYGRLALVGAKQRLEQMHKEVRMAEVQVRLLSHDPAATTDDSELELEPFEEQSLDYYESAMRRLRSESLQIANGMEASRLWARYRLSEMLPDIGMVSSFAYAYSTSSNDVAAIPGSGPRWTYGPGGYLALGLRAPLDFANRLAIYRIAQAEHRSNLARREYWMGGMGLEVEKALLDVKETRAREQRTGHAEKVARGWLVANDINWRTLRTDGRELMEVTRVYADWRLQHLRAVYDANLSLSWLKRTTGLANLVAPPK